MRSVAGAPAYIEFRIGDCQHELGIIDSRFATPDRSREAENTMTYWHVDDLEASVERLLSLGATLHGEPVEHGPGFVTASVADPFGNILGVMFNQHYLDTLAAKASA
ncbi:dioxygenase [Rhodococcus opacus RKJ300 = JCM 13270]|uniref:Dioxygenase n=1 Tax=Rhodococcus opacus RKJ300 = JCM 13270 TaxID=1165867 RepID=I0WXC5_RHOOP|nr:dioxygenase [Rhodococcus opacus RKJ300 = JCM 13270]